MNEQRQNSEDIVKTISGLKKLSQLGVQQMVKFAEDVAEEFVKKGVTTTQLRKFHGHLSKIWSKYSTNRAEYLKNSDAFRKEILEQAILMKAYLAYQVAREEKLEPLRSVLDRAIDKITDQEDFEFLKKFYDSIVAYFKYHEEEAKRAKGGYRR